MPLPKNLTTPPRPGRGSDCPDPQVVRALARACADFGADPVERLALFEAAIVASNLRTDRPEHDDRIGVLAQNSFWGKEPARRDPYTAATVFLRQARHLRTIHGRMSGARLAAAVQGRPGTWRHAAARSAARRALAQLADLERTPAPPQEIASAGADTALHRAGPPAGAPTNAINATPSQGETDAAIAESEPAPGAQRTPMGASHATVRGVRWA